MIWIYFQYGSDMIGAKVEGTKAERYFNLTKLEDRELKREYKPHEFQIPENELIFELMGAGVNISAVRGFTITDSVLTWDQILQKVGYEKEQLI